MSAKISEATNIDAIQFQEQASAPDTPASTYGVVYVKDDGTLHFKNDAGTDTDLTTGSSSIVNFGTAATKTISSGVVATGSDRNLVIAAESGTSDDLVEITGLTVGDKVLLRADAGDTITVKHNSGSATIKILIQDDADFVLDEVHPLELVLISTNQLVQVYDETGGGGLYESVAILVDQKTAGTHGGSSGTATWNARALNTEQSDVDSIVSLSSNQFTPVSGTYRITVFAPVASVNYSKVRVYNVTGTSTVIVGGNNYLATGGRHDYLSGVFTANGTDAYRIDSYTSTAVASQGLGVAANASEVEIYTVVILEKFA